MTTRIGRKATLNTKEVMDLMTTIADAPPEFREAISEEFKSPSDLFTLFTVESNYIATTQSGTGDLRVDFKPSNRLTDLVSALRAWERERQVSEIAREVA